MSAEPTARRTWPVWVGLGLYTAVRLALLPADPEVVPGFSHDSNYIAIVANNLLAGRGYVNDALWLVFLQPEQLPVPYHNANPLFPTAVAGLTWLTGQSAAWAGLALSAASSAALFAALFVLAGLCVRPVWQQALLAAAGTFFPAVFEDSLSMLPDAPCTALQAWCAASLFCARGPRAAALGGGFFGLAWLTRSSAVLMLPAVGLYLVLRDGWKPALGNAAVFGLVAAAVASPWLWHTAVVWGNPLRSATSYYLFEDYVARQRGIPVEHYWHSPEAPQAPNPLSIG